MTRATISVLGALGLVLGCSSDPTPQDAATDQSTMDSAVDTTPPADVTSDPSGPLDAALDQVAPSDVTQDARADLVAPDVVAPDVVAPDVVAPDVVAPDVVAPDVVAPDVVTPDATTDTAMPSDVTLTCDFSTTLTTFVRGTTFAGSAPAFTGGVLAEGSYALTGIEYYDGRTNVYGNLEELRLGGGRFQWLLATEGAPGVVRYGGTYSTSGSAFAVREDCASGGANLTFSYTASGAQIRIGKDGSSPSTSVVAVYTRR